MKSAFLQANEVRNKQVESLASKIAKLEHELVESRYEKVKLQTQCQSMVKQIQSLTSNAKREGEGSMVPSPTRVRKQCLFLSCDCLSMMNHRLSVFQCPYGNVSSKN